MFTKKLSSSEILEIQKQCCSLESWLISQHPEKPLPKKMCEKWVAESLGFTSFDEMVSKCSPVRFDLPSRRLVLFKGKIKRNVTKSISEHYSINESEAAGLVWRTVVYIDNSALLKDDDYYQDGHKCCGMKPTYHIDMSASMHMVKCLVCDRTTGLNDNPSDAEKEWDEMWRKQH